MTAVLLVGLLAAGILLLSIVGLIVDAIWPDPDLASPWTAGEPSPGPRRRPCLDSRCRIDHDAVPSNRRVW